MVKVPKAPKGGLSKFAGLFKKRTKDLEGAKDVIIIEEDIAPDTQEEQLDELLLTSTGTQLEPERAQTVLFQSTTSIGPKLKSNGVDHFPELMKVYDNPYEAMLDVIRPKMEEKGKVYHSQSDNFLNRLDRMLPILMYFTEGTQNEKNKLEREKPEGMSDAEHKKKIADLDAQLKNFQDILLMIRGLRALARNHCRITNDELKKQVETLKAKLIEGGVDEKTAEATAAMMREMVGKNEFKGRKSWQTAGRGSTGFDTTQDTMDLSDFKKRVKIEHKKGPDGKVEISAHFSYNRHRVLGTNPMGGHLKTGSSKDEVERLHRQAKDLVTVAIQAYGRGTSKENPLKIDYNGLSQPEAALAIMMEYKKRAIQMNREFHAVYYPDGPQGERKTVVISPKTGFATDEEKAYFMHYANQKPWIKSRVRDKLIAADECAGYKLLKGEATSKSEKLTSGLSFSDPNSSSEVVQQKFEQQQQEFEDAFGRYFEKFETGLKKHEKENFDKVNSSLPSTVTQKIGLDTEVRERSTRRM